MRTKLAKIGNSRGVRIPRPLIEQAGLRDELDVTVEDGAVVIRNARRPREGWEEAARRMAAAGDDVLLLPDDVALSSWDDEEWEWE